MQVHPYLNFDGNAEDALRFYETALKGKLSPIVRFGDMAGGEWTPPPAEAKKVMHAGVSFGNGQMLMASDVPKGMGKPVVVGTNSYISLHPDSRQEADRLFAALSEGGKVEMPMGDQAWGDYWGAFTDRFGTQWMINHHDASKDKA